MKYRKGIKKLLSLTGLKQFFKILNKKEKIIFFIFIFSIISSFLFISLNFYFKNTAIKPAKGGTYIEGLVGTPRFINPIYSPAYDVDRDLVELIYSGLMKYDENGEIVLDLAKEYQVLDDGKIFEFYLKENLFWSDGSPLTAEDVIFTVKTIQNPSLKSPIRANWIGISAEKISDTGIRFELKNSSAIFLENTTLKIIPKHIWENISDQNFPFSSYNLNPIGSGPYKIKKIKQDNQKNISSLELKINSNYHGNNPNISKIIFLFFESEEQAISAFNFNKIKGFSLNSAEKYELLKRNNFSSYYFLMPRYFAVFFNQNYSTEGAKVLADKNIRQALSYGINKEEIINEILLNKGKIVDSPILPNIYGFENPSTIFNFDIEKANEILEKAGFVKNENNIREKTIVKNPSFQFKSNLQTGSKGAEVEELQKCLEGEVSGYFGEKTKTAVIKFQEKYKSEVLTPHGLSSGTGRVLASTRKKLNEICFPSSKETFPLSFVLTTINQPKLIKTASFLKNSWENLGIEIEIKILDSSAFTEEVIRPRNYEMILFGQGLEIVIDPFPFWHSSQIKDPGLNLTGYENKETDKLLEKSRTSLDHEERKSMLEKFQNILIENSPAIFLYSPDYIYLASNEIKGISESVISDPSKRFNNIEDWYIKTKRKWK